MKNKFFVYGNFSPPTERDKQTRELMENPPQRESGFYYVKKRGVWTIAEWDQQYGSWDMLGNDISFYDNDFDEIRTPKIELPS